MVASMVAVFVALGGVVVALYKRGQNEGRIAEILSHLNYMATDHEARIRALEKLRSNEAL